ncbi:MAG: hypothetical protein ACRDD8_01200, partial [Bacteroidales bacterium]
MKTAKKMVTEKMERELCGKFSKKLKWMVDNKYITFKYDQEEIIVTFTFNGSWIKVLPETESSRGERSTCLVFEESRLLKKTSVDSIFMPMRHARVPLYRTKAEYASDNRLVENAKVIYLTSTRYKYEWFWKSWVNTTNDWFNNTKQRYGIFCGDIETSIFHNFVTRDDIEVAKKDMSDSDFRMEYLNEPIGEVEGSFFELESFKKNSVIKNPFLPPTSEDFIFKYLKGEIPYFREKKEEEKRALFIDFSFSDTVKRTQSNDLTVIGCGSCFPTEKHDHMFRNCEAMETLSGGKKDESILRIRELFYLYQADYIIVDIRNGG